MTRLFVNRAAAWALALLLGIPFATMAKDTNPPAKLKMDVESIDRDARSGQSYSSVVKKVTPSVVNIYSTMTMKAPRFHQFLDDPFFDRFFGGGGQGRRAPGNNMKRESLGSGVIVTGDGYILTNNHVVEGADADGVKVALGDGKAEIPAKVVGTDPQTDIAVLKIDAKDLPAITLADSDKLEVGDVVLAVGNPFNVGQSVSMGIISALGRGGFQGFRIADYEDFIQTDAAINPGNSGGALVDARGRLIGINQSIASPVRGNSGVGFAVPVNLARSVMERLVDDGKMTRGYLGVGLQTLTPELAKAFDLSNSNGALVGEVMPGTPAATAGLKAGDIIIQVDGKDVADARHLRLTVAGYAPGAKLPLTLIQNGKQKTISVTLTERPGEEGMQSRGSGTGEAPARDALDGVEVGDIDAQARQQFGVPNNIRGALVMNVEPDSNSYEAGLRPGCVILEIDRQTVSGADDAVELSNKVKGDRILLRIWSRDGEASGSRFLTVDNTKKP